MPGALAAQNGQVNPHSLRRLVLPGTRYTSGLAPRLPDANLSQMRPIARILAHVQQLRGLLVHPFALHIKGLRVCSAHNL
jgi:hypothetical protein